MSRDLTGAINPPRRTAARGRGSAPRRALAPAA